jgi:hypothetical protein
MTENTKVGLRADRILGMTAAACAASAGVGLVGDASTAQAAIVYSGPVNIAIPDNIDGVYMNIVTGATGSSGGSVAGWDINPYSALPGEFYLWGPTTNTWFSSSGLVGGPYPLAANTLIEGPNPAFFRPGGSLNVGTQVTLNAPNLFGFRFTNEGGGTNHFAWMEITFGATAGQRAITRYAFESTPNVGIRAGAVPEPGSLSLLALGALGLCVRRRNRAA